MDIEEEHEGYGEELGEGEEYEGEEEAEGEMDTEDEEYNLTHFGISQALPVPEGPPDFSAGPPQTAEEYLQWVRYEAAQCPRVTRKDVDPEKLASSKRQAQDQNPDSADAAGDGTSEPGSSGAAASGDGAGGGGGGGGSGGGASRGRRRGTAFAAQVPPPVDAECQDWARPNPKWLTVFLQDFARLRQALAAMRRSHVQELSATELPHLDNVRAWDRLCFEQWQSLEQQEQGQGQQQTGQTAGGAGSGTGGGGDGRGTAAGGVGGNGEEEQEEEEDAGPPPPPPTSSPPPGAGGQSGAGGHGGGGGGGETDRLCGPVVRTVLAMDQVAVGCLLQRHVAQLSALPLPSPPPRPPAPAPAPAPADGSSSNSGTPSGAANGSSSRGSSRSSSSTALSYMRCQWLFALAAVLERPVPPDVSAALRELVRRCCALRAGLSRSDDPSLPRLNVLLAVAGGYFGQDEHLSGAAAAAGLADLA
ncbi:hypothetical protein CHLRE_09g405650v5 [Chlamydomonas reinhardtii]|uniref:Gem-associated protein 2 n=1 Tax=Chlamydomonas reinhardtii TaxID=3055 RepID=A0A2K3DF81_CHLRE|nr:uncharacterized protein CHLRE_09g405650v5 [Chlamydomonas reinhardtii]PNW79194.1 hypothetical protein CHLRE_09g405650v5 [Chlamydomonas reinhardtii]